MTKSFWFPQPFSMAFAIGWCLCFHGSLSAEAWVSPVPSLGHKTTTVCSANYHLPSRCRRTTALYYSSEFGNSTDSTSSASSPTAPASIVERLRVNGVSVSPKGFHVLLESTRGGRDSNPKDASAERTEEAPPPSPAQDEGEPLASSSKPANGKRASSLLPLKVTNDPADAYAATSPESLTLCQLLSGVDMAGAILPPELLGKIVVCHVEDKLDALYEDDDEEEEEDDDETEDAAAAVFAPVLTAVEGKIWEYLQNQQALMREQKLFGSDQSSQEISSFRVQMPQVTLDQLTLVPTTEDGESISWQCKLECALPEWKESLVVNLKADLLASLAYNYDPESSPLFTCIALALRYKAPIVLEQPSGVQEEAAAAAAAATTTTGPSSPPPPLHQDRELYYFATRDDLDRDFPQRTTLENLQQQSTRVTQNIEKGFEIHKLTGALQIAMRLGDHKAAEKIRAKLDEYDSMEDLPTLQSKDDSKTKQHPTHDDDSSDRLDDLENNILQ